MAPRRAALAFIYVTVLLDMLAFGVAIPVLPFLYEELSGGATARAAEMAGSSASRSPRCSSCSGRCWGRSRTASAGAR